MSTCKQAPTLEKKYLDLPHISIPYLKTRVCQVYYHKLFVYCMTNRGLILYIKEALIWVFFPFDLLSQSYPSTNCHRIYLYSMNISFNFIICLFVAAFLCRKLNYIVVATAFHGRCPLSKHVDTLNASMLNNDVNLCLSCL